MNAIRTWILKHCCCISHKLDKKTLGRHLYKTFQFLGKGKVLIKSQSKKISSISTGPFKQHHLLGELLGLLTALELRWETTVVWASPLGPTLPLPHGADREAPPSAPHPWPRAPARRASQTGSPYAPWLVAPSGSGHASWAPPEQMKPEEVSEESSEHTTAADRHRVRQAHLMLTERESPSGTHSAGAASSTPV